MKKGVAILRARRFSPNSVENDADILRAVVSRLEARGMTIRVIHEEYLSADDLQGTAFVISMGRLPETLHLLKSLQSYIINSPDGVTLCCQRNRLYQFMQQLSIPVAPAVGTDGYWLKRADASAQVEGDVVFVPNETALRQDIETFRRRGISDYLVTAHVAGDIVKFYGIRGTGYFRYFYPTDDGHSKFGHERHNGAASHFSFQVEALRQCIERLATAVGIDVYGGDCIVRSNGTFCIIDFNDWPSFSRCREEAANAISAFIVRKLSYHTRPKGYIFDYGGTLDTGGNHWGKVFWHTYQRLAIPVEEQNFREAYVFAERQLGSLNIINPEDTFRRTLEKKVRLQLQYLNLPDKYGPCLVDEIYHDVCRHTANSRQVLSQMPEPKVLVSNFYGNLQAVLREFGLDGLFTKVIESAQVGIRKPDPKLFLLGVQALGLQPEEVAVVGDSIKNDIVPAHKIGCKTIWYRGEQWHAEPSEECIADSVITDLAEINMFKQNTSSS